MIPSPDLSSFTVFSRGPESFVQVTHSEKRDDAEGSITHVWKTVDHPTFTACITLIRSEQDKARFFGKCSLVEKEGDSEKRTEKDIRATTTENQISLFPEGLAGPVTWSLKKEGEAREEH